jgi:hypothetical protein
MLLVLVLSLIQRRARSLLFWAPVTLVLGPVGVLAWWIVGRQAPFPHPSSPPAPVSGAGEGKGRWRAAILEAAGDVAPTAVAYLAYVALALALPEVMGSQGAQLGLILGLPLALGWLVVQGPLLALASRRGYLRTLWERLPHVLIAANLGLAGMSTIVSPLLNAITRTCSIFPSPGWSAGILWAIVALGALPGGLLLSLYHLWAIKRGLWAWGTAAGGGGTVRSGAWRALWWWVLLSVPLLVGGLAVGILLQHLLAA